jgi:hypothetical protein
MNFLKNNSTNICFNIYYGSCMIQITTTLVLSHLGKETNICSTQYRNAWIEKGKFQHFYECVNLNDD